jgi:hypothetical protein
MLSLGRPGAEVGTRLSALSDNVIIQAQTSGGRYYINGEDQAIHARY